jgi:hypothetical protein
MIHPAIVIIADALSVYRALQQKTFAQAAFDLNKPVEEIYEWADIFGLTHEVVQGPVKPLHKLIGSGPQKGGNYRANVVSLKSFEGAAK